MIEAFTRMQHQPSIYYMPLLTKFPLSTLDVDTVFSVSCTILNSSISTTYCRICSFSTLTQLTTPLKDLSPLWKEDFHTIESLNQSFFLNGSWHLSFGGNSFFSNNKLSGILSIASHGSVFVTVILLSLVLEDLPIKTRFCSLILTYLNIVKLLSKHSYFGTRMCIWKQVSTSHQKRTQ